uniref:Uncharacterized protein n=1 Tax=Oryza brachyantha TaxID=4533 RepID=J3LVX6_ORYBR
MATPPPSIASLSLVPAFTVRRHRRSTAGFDSVEAPVFLEVIAEVLRGSEEGKWHPSLIILT